MPKASPLTRRRRGNDEYTTLLLHFDGEDESTTFTDSSASAHSITVNGAAQMDTAQSVFGGSSGLFNGSTSYLSIANATSLQMGSGDFTIDYWVRYAAGSVHQTILDKGYTAGGALLIQTLSGAMPALVVYLNGTAVAIEASGAALNTWYHYAIVRNGTAVKIYRNGILTASGTSSANLNNTAAVDVARGSIYLLNGWLDEFRISKGVARWTSNFTPQPVQYRYG